MMKRLCALFVAVILFTPICFNVQANTRKLIYKPDCVKCGWYGSCRSCKSGSTAPDCTTPDCGTCTTVGFCVNYNSVPQSPSQVGESPVVEPSTESMKSIRLNDEIIKEVGAKHPRFAATLANANMFGFYPEKYEIHWTPIEILPEDVDAFINRKKYESFFKKYNERARQINQKIISGEITEIVYSMTVSRIDASNWAIKIQCTQNTNIALSDPGYSSLDIRLTYAGESGESEKPVKSSVQFQ